MLHMSQEEYKLKKQKEMEYAISVVESFQSSTDQRVKYRDSRPITDIKHMWESSVSEFGHNVAFHVKDKSGDPYRTITYLEAKKDVDALGTALISMGLKNKKIAMISDNRYEWAVSYLAIVGGVGIVVPLDKELTPSELEQLVNEAEVECVIFSKKYEKFFKQMKDEPGNTLNVLINMDGCDEEKKVFGLKEIIAGGSKLLDMGNRYFLDAQIERDEMGIILFTSGTTGIAKGVMLSHGNIVEDLMAAPTLLKVLTTDIFFSVLPIHHTYECTCGFLMPLYKGASIAYCEGLKYIVKNLSEVRPTMFLGVPLIFESLYKKIWQNARKTGKEKMLKRMIAINNKTKKIGINIGPLFLKQIIALFGGRMRMMICGGAAIDPAILQGLRDFGIPALQGYGLTECAPISALNPDQFIKNESAGCPLPGFDVKILNPDPETGIGEICTKGKNTMLGYYKNPEASAEVLVDGWFHTGDLGYLDEEKYIFITGRQKSVIITKNGKNVFPEEIEHYIGRIPYVEECLVWAKESQGGADTTIAATIRVATEEIEPILGKVYTVQEVETLLWKEVDKLNEELPYFKRIKKIVVKESAFEKTTGKKIKRFVEANRE